VTLGQVVPPRPTRIAPLGPKGAASHGEPAPFHLSHLSAKSMYVVQSAGVMACSPARIQ
jgi:hypothetical protein